MKPIESEIDRLEKEILERENKIRTLVELRSMYPDLRVHEDKNNVRRYCSKSGAQDTNSIDISQACSCCIGAVCLAWPYFVLEGVKIFSDPVHFDIGFGNENGFGVIPSATWRDRMKEAGVSHYVIIKAQDYLSRHAPVTYQEVEDAEEK